MSQTLVEIFSEIGNFSGVDLGANDKGSLHSYLETYDKLFEPFRKGCSLLEIGLATGSSIDLWDKYFEASRIVGIDLSIVFRPYGDVMNGNVIYLIEGDATKPNILEKIDEQVGSKAMFNIILDDGSHVTSDQIATFNLLKGRMNKGGLYFVEDILALDIEREKYLALHNNCEIIDLRHVKNRFDDVLICYKF